MPHDENITPEPSPPTSQDFAEFPPHTMPPHPHIDSATSSDPYELTKEAIQDPPITWGETVKYIGPGLILTASIVGTGELIATTNLGAKAGFALLWLVVLSCFIKVFVQIELGRSAISSGDTTLTSFQRIPKIGDALCWWWFAMMFLSQFQIGAMIGGTAQALNLAMPWGAQVFSSINPDISEEAARKAAEIFWAVVVTLVSIYLLIQGRYTAVERTSTILVALFTLLTIAVMVLLPFISTNIVPQPAPEGAPEPDSSGLWMAAFAMVGITGVGASELISYPYWCLEKRYARFIGPHENTDSWLARAKGWLRVMHADAWLSMIVYTLATIAFYVLGAAVLFKYTGGRGLSSGGTGQLLQELAKMYEPVLGQKGSIWFIMIGGFIVLYSTLYAATAGNCRVTTDFLRVQGLVPFSPQAYRIRWIRLLSAWFPLLALGLYLFVQNPVFMVVIGGVAQALTLPMIAAVAIYVRWKVTDKRLVVRGVWDVLLWISLVAFTIAAGYGLWTQRTRIDDIFGK
ncbi:MAG: Nramp family divalent metal transporter [Gemmataceae bacterium]